MPFCKFLNLFGILISHQEIAGKGAHDLKKLFVVNVRMRIQATSRVLAPSRVRRVNEKSYARVVPVLPEGFKAITLLTAR